MIAFLSVCVHLCEHVYVICVSVCVPLTVPCMSIFDIVCAMIYFSPRSDEVSVPGGVAVPVLKSLGWQNNSPTYGWNAAGAASSYGYCTGQQRSQGDAETRSPTGHEDIVDSALMDVAPRKVNPTKVGKRLQLLLRSYASPIHNNTIPYALCFYGMDSKLNDIL